MPLRKVSDWFVLLLFLATALAFVLAGNDRSQTSGAHIKDVQDIRETSAVQTSG